MQVSLSHWHLLCGYIAYNFIVWTEFACLKGDVTVDRKASVDYIAAIYMYSAKIRVLLRARTCVRVLLHHPSVPILPFDVVIKEILIFQPLPCWLERAGENPDRVLSRIFSLGGRL